MSLRLMGVSLRIIVFASQQFHPVINNQSYANAQVLSEHLTRPTKLAWAYCCTFPFRRIQLTGARIRSQVGDRITLWRACLVVPG